MRVILQRVNSANVKVSDAVVGEIQKGLLVLVGIASEDNLEDVDYIVGKTLGLRIFNNQIGKFDFSVQDIEGDLLVVSQFTLYADTRKGKRPSFINAMEPSEASKLFNITVRKFKESGLKVETGKFQEKMQVSSINDGPVTIFIDSKN
ncbi:MAG TPA: D-aminoacyl-tRNA deacylase [SAR202 cluster bacterium]|jgi:D-tyrosyl-tRNA(Tyr) deacylase|nr:D-aminoacyl-tRNA deacylase [SAR202 cluster bacterium]|tara:strand:+ start:24282 stop:24725 length:444 start_codon:yes stop_codon:yes gene_type:complete